MKTQSKHTAGPWHFNQVGNHPFVSSPNGERIANCGPDDNNWLGWESEQQAQANAQLIANAPDLLCQRDELKAALQALKDGVFVLGLLHGQKFCSVAMDQARAALAKAGGAA